MRANAGRQNVWGVPLWAPLVFTELESLREGAPTEGRPYKSGHYRALLSVNADWTVCATLMPALG